MKWLNFLLFGLLALALNACQQHSASELNLIKMPNEHVPQAQDTGKSQESAAPAQDTKSAPGYLQ